MAETCRFVLEMPPGAGERAGWRFLSLLACLLALGGGRGAWAAIEFVTPQGTSVLVHDADEVTRRWVLTDGTTVRFSHPTAGDLELLNGPGDARLTRGGDESFVPLDPVAVAGAIAAFATISPRFMVEIFLLPSPPAVTLGSFARRDAIFLSPGFGPVPEATLAALVAHEFGHVLTWGYIDPRPDRWEAWRARRGLGPDAGDATAPHAARAREILAEDIRYLFGGPLAREGQGIENRDLPLPDAVAGLREELASWLAGAPPLPEPLPPRAFPNPSRAGVAIEVAWPTGAGGAGAERGDDIPTTARLDIFDLRGRRVAGAGGARIANGRLALAWDGRDAGGRPVAAGPYLYTVSWPGGTARGTLIRAH